MDYIALFFTTSGAMRFKRNLQKIGTEAEALPVPRKLSSSCGIAIKFKWIEDPMSLIDDSVEKLYQVNNSDYTMLYDEESAP